MRSGSGSVRFADTLRSPLCASCTMRFHLLCVAGMAFMALLAGCREEKKLGIASTVNPRRMATLSTRNVESLISDSGFTKYKILTPLWNVYSEREEPYWDFPEGVYLRQLDKKLQVVATVAADSAKYFTDKKLWQLMGNVEIDQPGRSYFSSQRIFFDDRMRRIYSDTFIHIETPTQILEGMGFESNQDLTQYTVLRPTGLFPVEQVSERGDSNTGGVDNGRPSPASRPDPMQSPVSEGRPTLPGR